MRSWLNILMVASHQTTTSRQQYDVFDVRVEDMGDHGHLPDVRMTCHDCHGFDGVIPCVTPLQL